MDIKGRFTLVLSVAEGHASDLMLAYHLDALLESRVRGLEDLRVIANEPLMLKARSDRAHAAEPHAGTRAVVLPVRRD
jgi:hypothetical protein